MAHDFRTNVSAEDLHLDPNKPTVLVVSDSAAIHSGFAQVARNVFRELWKNHEWNIVQHGWWHQMPSEQVPWPIVTTDRDPDRPELIDHADKYGEMSFDRVVEAAKPDLVWIMGDPWMLTPTLTSPKADSFFKLAYVPVDGAPLIYSWKVIENADLVVPYLPFGGKVMKRWVPDANIGDHIPHGVDCDLYRPLPQKERERIRVLNMKIEPEHFLMLTVCRNQSRKNLPALFEVTRYLRTGDYRVCKHCNRAVRNPWDYSMGQPTGDVGICTNPECVTAAGTGVREGNLSALNYMEDAEPNPNFHFMAHTPIEDLHGHSWNFTSLMDAMDMGVPDEKHPGELRYPGFRWNEHIKPVQGMPEADMVKMYNAADLFTLASTGEGFGLPLLEAMACGIPVLAANVSSHPDFVNEGGGILVDIGNWVCEAVSTYYRGYADIDDYLDKVRLLIKDKKLRLSLGEAARQTAMKYDWSFIVPQWRDLINKCIGERRTTKSWRKLSLI